MASKYEQPPQPEGQKTLMEQVRAKAAEAAPAVIAAALGATLGYLGAEAVRETAIKSLVDTIQQFPQVGDTLHLGIKVIAKKTQEMPGIFAAVGGGYGAMAAFTLGRREKSPSAEQEQGARSE